MDRVDYWGKRHGIFEPGDAIVGTILYGHPTAYQVRDYWGNVVCSGSISGKTLTIPPPVGGFRYGWYRVLLTGTQTDALFGPSYGASSFIITPHDDRLPANPPTGTTAPPLNAGGDLIMKAVLGIGTSRISIADAANIGSGGDSITNALANAAVGRQYWTAPASPLQQDTVRASREMFIQFTTTACDSLALAGPATGTWLRCYALSGTLNGADLFIGVSAGTVSGKRLTVAYPDPGTVVETWDNLATANAAQIAINAGSTYIRVFPGGQTTAADRPATAVGSAKWNGVVQVVAQAYAAGVTRFEGPSNEPNMNAETAHCMKLFAAAVHVGNSNAKAIGPAPVNATTIEPFLAAGGGEWCDEISIHDYNCCVNGDVGLARTYIESFFAALDRHGQTGKPVWQTEAGGSLICCFGIYHPRRARGQVFHDLLWEQYGVPRERNPAWYDTSHGFWSYPCWISNGYGSLNPQAPMYRVLALETFGRAYVGRLSFGPIGDRMFLGNIYDGPSGRTVVVMACSHMDDATVTLNVPGLSTPVILVDAFGNQEIVTPVGGHLVVPATEVPQYVRLPAGQQVSVATCMDWPAVALDTPSPSDQAAVWHDEAIGLVRALGNGAFQKAWGSLENCYWSSSEAPSTLTASWETGARFDRVIIWCGQALNNQSVLVDFDVQTSNDGQSWTTRATVTRPAPTTYLHGTNYWNTGCRWETFWDEQWIFDVPLAAPVTAKHLRLNVRSTSYGGEPTAETVADGGLGDGAQRVFIQEVALLCFDNLRPHAVRSIE
jgi:hypothetical protein